MPQVAIVVLGMHRSGTSALTRTLSLMGAALPNVLMPPAVDNVRGFWEPVELVGLNDELFASEGINWDDIALLDPNRLQSSQMWQFEDKARDIIKSNYGDAPFFVVKDPRMCRLLPFWLKVFFTMGIDPRCVIISRNPMEVAQSLHRRSQYPVAKSLILWLLYNLEAERYTRNLLRTFVTFDNLLKNWPSALSKVSNDLRIEWPSRAIIDTSEIEDFLSNDLRHHDVKPQAPEGSLLVDKWTTPLYRCIEAAAADCEVNLTETFDGIRSEIEAADVLYGPLVSRYKQELNRIQSLMKRAEEKLDKKQAEIDELVRKSSILSEELVKRQSDVEGLADELSFLRHEVSALKTELKRRDIEIEHVARQRSNLEQENQAILKSISWRATEPMRQIRRMIPSRNRMVRDILRLVRWGPIFRLSTMLSEKKIEKKLRASSLFDAAYYLERNPDVANAGVNPYVHYLRHGATEGRDPHPLFDTSFYLEQKPRAAEMGVNPLLHFLEEGPTEEFNPVPMDPLYPFEGICIVTPDIVGPVKNGGIGTACYHFARSIANSGELITVLFTGDLTDCQKAHWRNFYSKMKISFLSLSDTPIERDLIPYGSTWCLETSWKVYRFLKESCFKVVHFQDWQANGFWSINCKRLGMALSETLLTVTMHSSTKWITQGMQEISPNSIDAAKLVWAETFCMENCDVLLSPSQHMFEWAQSQGIKTSERKLLTPYCYCENNSAELIPNQMIDHDHIIFFGRLETRKGIVLFGDALRLIARKRLNLPGKISFLGKHALANGEPSSDYLAKLQQDLPNVEIATINHFNHLEAIDYIKSSKGLVVVPSLLDNYPLTVVEAIQNGIPFIAARTGGIPEMASDDVLFDPNPADMAELLINREKIDHKRIQHKYSSSKALRIWLNVNEALLLESTDSSSKLNERLHAGSTRVSVCTPFYNHGQFLHSLVAAFAKQKYPNFEMILVNDGSGPYCTEQFQRVAADFARDSRFKFLAVENCGPGGARNYAASKASGDYLIFFDADNLPKNEGFINSLVSAIEVSEADCVTCGYDIVDARVEIPEEEDVNSVYRPIGSCLEAGLLENVFGDATMIIRSDVFNKVGGFPTTRQAWEDWEFLLKLCLEGFKLLAMPESLYYYRQSVSGRNSTANSYVNFRSLMDQLVHAENTNLAKILKDTILPILLSRR